MYTPYNDIIVYHSLAQNNLQFITPVTIHIHCTGMHASFVYFQISRSEKGSTLNLDTLIYTHIQACYQHIFEPCQDFVHARTL